MRTLGAGETAEVLHPGHQTVESLLMSLVEVRIGAVAPVAVVETRESVAHEKADVAKEGASQDYVTCEGWEGSH